MKNNTKSDRSLGESLPYVGGALLVCLLIVVLTGIALWQEAQRYRERSEVFAQNTTKLLAQHIGDVFADAESLSEMVAYHFNELRSRGELETVRFNTYLNHAMSANGGSFLAIRVIDGQGVLRYGTGDAITPIDLSDRDYFTRLRELPAGSASSPMIFSGPIFTRITKKWVLVMARRLENPDGSFAGIVIVNLHNEAFGGLFASIKLGTHGAIVLRTIDMAQIDRFRRGTKPDENVGNRKVSEKLLELIRTEPQSGTYKATSKFDQIDRYYSYRKVGSYPFYIIVGEATQDFLDSLGRGFYLMLGFGVLMMVLTIAGFRRIYQLSQQRTRERISQKAELIIDASPLPILVENQFDVVRSANQAALDLFGYPRQQIIGMAGDHLVAQQSRSALTELTHHFLQNPVSMAHRKKLEVIGLRQDGSELPLQASVSFIELDQVRHSILILEDLTERKKMNAELNRLAREDALTGLSNRLAANERLHTEFVSMKRSQNVYSVLMVDIDFFKRVNDTHGHAVGDQVLQRVANILNSTLRESDFAARFGGEEFLALLPATNTPAARQVAEKLRQAVESSPDPVAGKMTLSIGVSLGTPDQADEDVAVREADDALYRAKREGRNQVQVAPECLDDVETGDTVPAKLLQLVWRSSYECGNQTIDVQHRGLFRDANKLLLAALSGRPVEELVALVEAFVAEVIQHFQDEEAILVEAGYPGATAHAALHRALIDKAGVLTKHVQTGSVSPIELFEFLAHDVVAQHLLSADREFFSYLQTKH